MATKLNNRGGGQPLNIASVLAAKGRTLHSGFLDEHDREAMRHDNAMRRINNFRPRKLGQTRSGFGKAVHSPNADRHNLSMVS